MVKSAVITGVAGFIGSHLADALLRQGWRVAGIDNFDPFYERGLKDGNLGAARAHASFQLFEVDIRDRATLAELMQSAKPAAVFHLAALAGVRPSIREPARFVDVNVNGTAAVLEAARAAQCPTLIFASSSSVYGNNPKTPFAEDDAVDHPISPYAATKRAGELLCHTYAHLHGLRIACLRFFTVFGPAQRPDLAIMKFMRLIAAGQPVPMFGDGSTSRDYTYIDDIIGGVLAACEAMESGRFGHYRIWNLGNSAPITLRDMIESIGRVVGRAPSVQSLPLEEGDVERTWADLARSRRELGFQPRTPFEAGLRTQWEWLRSAR